MSSGGVDIEPGVPVVVVVSPPWWQSRLFRALGPGLVTGAADDDPSGIATLQPGRRPARLWAGLLMDARAFYGAIALATLVGLGLNFVGIDPIKALYWSAVLNGLLAAPLMAMMLLIATNRKAMGELTLPWAMQAVGWSATLVMLVASVAFLVL